MPRTLLNVFPWKEMDTSLDLRPTPTGSESLKTFEENMMESSSAARHEKGSGGAENVPRYEKWKTGIQMLLDDMEGSKTFYEFLETDQLAVLFECWHSCVNYRKQHSNKATAKEVYTRYVRIKDARVPISDQARNNLAMRLRANNTNETLLQEIEQEVFANLRDVCYPKFLKSDFFTFYCETFGQVKYEASDFHRFGKPFHLKSMLPSLEEDRLSEFQAHQSNDIQRSSVTPNEREISAPSLATKTHLEPQSLISDAFIEGEKMSTGDSRISGGSDGRSKHLQNFPDDHLPNLPNFKPRTQRSEAMKQIDPNTFANLLIEKLEKVQFEQLNAEMPPQESYPAVQPTMSHYYNQNPLQATSNDGDSQTWIMPPASDRYSVAGASSHSGSHTEQRPKYRNRANKLLNVVHHGIRNNLGECQCPSCHDAVAHQGYAPQDSLNAYWRSEHYSKPVPHFDHTVPYEYNQQNVFMQAEMPPPIDNSKILAWMERNEKFEQHPSPAFRRKKPNNIPEAPIAQDHGMPLLPQPDTGTVLTEVKRVLEEPKRSSRRRSQQYHPMSSNSSYHNDRMSAYSDPSYDQRHMGQRPPWFSDSNSTASYNPSQISSVPSSASRLWNQYGYYDPQQQQQQQSKRNYHQHSRSYHGDVSQRRGGREHYSSDVTGDRHSDVTRGDRHSDVTRGDRHSDVTRDRHSDVTRGDRHSDVTRGDRHSDVMHNDARSERTNGSSSSGKTKNSTTVTYYFGMEPIPYRITVAGGEVTLRQFKAETKRGNYRFYFKTISPDDGEVVYEEIRNDDDYLPRYKHKIIGKVEKVE